jgi:hypothetical protein
MGGEQRKNGNTGAARNTQCAIGLNASDIFGTLSRQITNCTTLSSGIIE